MIAGRMTEAEVRAAFVIYRERDLSTYALARLIWQRYGFPSEKSCAQAIRRAFKKLGLPRRPAAQAARIAHTTHGRASRSNPDEYRRYMTEWHRRRRGSTGERCAGIVRTSEKRARKTGRAGRPKGRTRGERCSLPVANGSRFCRHHDHEGR